MKVVQNLDSKKKIYTCKVCDICFNWTDDSWNFGSLKQWDEEPSKLLFFCSTKCKNTFEKEFEKKS